MATRLAIVLRTTFFEDLSLIPCTNMANLSALVKKTEIAWASSHVNNIAMIWTFGTDQEGHSWTSRRGDEAAQNSKHQMLRNPKKNSNWIC